MNGDTAVDSIPPITFGLINGMPIDGRIIDLEDDNDDSWDLGNSGEPIFQEMALPVDSNRNAIKEQHEIFEQRDISNKSSSEDNNDNFSNSIKININKNMMMADDDENNDTKTSEQDWGEWDVPFGQSQEIQNFVGTRRYQALLAQYRSSYVNAPTRADKVSITAAIFATIHEHGGRFLDKKNAAATAATSSSNHPCKTNNSDLSSIGATSSVTEEWVELAKEAALAKISQALRIPGSGSSTFGSSGENKSSVSDCDDVEEGIRPSANPLAVGFAGPPHDQEQASGNLTHQQQQLPAQDQRQATNEAPAAPTSATPSSSNKTQSHFADPLGIFKSIYSMALLLFCIVVVMALIFDKQTSLSEDTHPAFAFILIWLAFIWLALVEGGQASMVGLPPIDRELYKESHHISYRICEHGHRGDNLDRYLIGRQFMVLALVFVINLSGSPIEGADVLHLPEAVATIFLKSGLALILITGMVGQLNTQVNASHCMLDFLNNWGNWFTVKVAMAIEASGILHASYLIGIIVFKLAGKKIESNEEPRNRLQNILFWGRVVMSCGILIFAFFATIAALFQGKTTVWENVPKAVALILFVFFMAIVGMLEGMQIAFYAVAKLTDEERQASVWATRTCELLFRGEGHNLPGFMVGRQLFVVACFFVIARITSMDVDDGESNVLGVSTGVQEFFNTGLLAALVTTIVASIAWQLVASAFPLAFLSTPVTYILLRICLFLEATGICQSVWVLAAIHKQLAGFQRDEVYVGTAEERAAMQEESDKPTAPPPKSGKFMGSAFPATHYLLPYYTTEPMGLTPAERRRMINENIVTLTEQLDHAETAEDRQVYQAALMSEHSALRQLVWR
ncbi:hypothetical protein ACA910_005319 [Epithemia clementina (nom. ined.)]